MPQRLFASLKARIVLFTVAILIIAIWLLAWRAVHGLRQDLGAILASQQLAAVSSIADGIDDAVRTRLDALAMVAAGIDAAHLADRTALDAYLASRRAILGLYNLGLYVIDASGRGVAERPDLGRVGADFSGIEYFREAMETRRPAIGKPRVGRFAKRPLVVFAVPILDPGGRPLGVLAGGNLLQGSDVFSRIAQTRLEESGILNVVSVRDRLFVNSNNPDWVLQPIAPPGTNRVLDRFLAGRYGSGISVNSHGTEMLMSGKDVPSAGWLVTAGLPTAKAFAPLSAGARRIYGDAGLLTLAAALLTWLYMRRELRALERSAALIRDMSGGTQPLEPVPVQGSEEIRALQSSFNALQARLRAQQETISRESARNALFLNSASDGVHILDEEGRVVEANPAFCEMLGYSRDEMLGMHVSRWDAMFSAEELAEGLQRLVRSGNTVFTSRHRRCDGRIIDVELRTVGFVLEGRPMLHASARDITERKQAEDALRVAAVAFDSQDGMLVTDARARILRVNSAFTRITGYAAHEVVGCTPAVLKSGRQDEDFYRRMWRALETEGRWQGELWNRKKSGETYPEWLSISAVQDARGRVTHYVGAFSDISERKAAETQIRHLAFYDSLTNLPNRRLLMDRLSHALAASARSRRHGALLFLDLDYFKTLNDTRGHDVGDLLLTQVAGRLLASVREDDTVVRLGGDEFVVMLEDLGTEEQDAATRAEYVAEKIRVRLAEAYELVGAPCHMTASIGVSLFRNHGESVEELLKHADLALYQAKDAGRNTVRFFNPAMQAALDARAALEAGLRRALAGGELRLHYQPQVDRHGALIGAEALLRWQHPERGLLGPGEFIALAEESGLILPIGDWVLHAACGQLEAWGGSGAAPQVAVNVSARQFRQADFVERVRLALAKTGADARRLKLELTESLVLDDVDDSIAKMQALKALGVGFSLDDFGTGYSSLAYLKRLPLDQLKIDQSFVRDIASDPSDAAIVEAILAMSRTLQLDVIAEGVEEDIQREFLEARGCHAFQGYLFGRPMPAEAFEAWLPAVARME